MFKDYCMFSVIDKIIAHTSSMATKKTLSFIKRNHIRKQHKEDLLTSFFFFGIKCATFRAAFVQLLRKTLSTVLIKLLLFAHLKILTFYVPLFICQSQKCFSFLKTFSLIFFFCSKTSKAGQAKKLNKKSL